MGGGGSSEVADFMLHHAVCSPMCAICMWRCHVCHLPLNTSHSSPASKHPSILGWHHLIMFCTLYVWTLILKNSHSYKRCRKRKKEKHVSTVGFSMNSHSVNGCSLIVRFFCFGSAEFAVFLQDYQTQHPTQFKMQPWCDGIAQKLDIQSNCFYVFMFSCAASQVRFCLASWDL